MAKLGGSMIIKRRYHTPLSLCDTPSILEGEFKV